MTAIQLAAILVGAALLASMISGPEVGISVCERQVAVAADEAAPNKRLGRAWLAGDRALRGLLGGRVRQPLRGRPVPL